MDEKNFQVFTYKSKSYETDFTNSLIDPAKWDRNFAEGMAAYMGMAGELTNEHWKVIQYIHDSFEKKGACPLIYAICRDNNLTLKEFKNLFPIGNQRCACKLAGISFRKSYVFALPKETDIKEFVKTIESKTYLIDSWGFLVNSNEWDKNFAVNKANELKMQGELTAQHWKIINYLRNRFHETGTVPTIFELCEDNKIELKELETLYPDGYHRGAVKLAGLRI